MMCRIFRWDSHGMTLLHNRPTGVFSHRPIIFSVPEVHMSLSPPEVMHLHHHADCYATIFRGQTHCYLCTSASNIPLLAVLLHVGCFSCISMSKFNVFNSPRMKLTVINAWSTADHVGVACFCHSLSIWV